MSCINSVLLVDDDERILHAYAARLKPRAVYTSTNVVEARALAAKVRPELALIDLRLENQPPLAALGLKGRRAVCGTDLVRVLRRDHPRMKIVMISSGRAWAYSKEARDAGANGMLCKMYGAEKIMAIIEGEKIDSHDLPPLEPASLARNEHEHIARVFVMTGRNVLRTARLLGVSRTTLKRKLSENICTAEDALDD